ncbi:unnamed protein product [Acanthoscelides obtectus]|uniref:Major facilitator superfamily (MFS) profile domain-containing protein n=1 Tax=Acanthoscelides obtectus TaxID=200917 RepID=A0A9P0JMN5_ACAOB|nr:unnamed protein product [Acanthoscelides obtectus]CAK1672981.1 Vesicular glutamate transporter 2 [Acanthoscelides obtectus]
MFGMRTSMGIIKVKMSNTTWDRETLASMDAAIFYGYFVTQIPGGLIAAIYPANKLFGAAIGFSCFLNLFLPSFQHKPHAFIFVKVIQGLVEGVTYPACHGIMRHWAPPLERSRLATLAFTGSYAGVMFAMPITGELVEHWGIVAPFYFYGAIGILWYLAWLWLVFEKPAYHTCIELKELALIETSLGGSQESYVAPSLTSTPWLTFFTSMPCHAIFVANFCRSWNFYLLVMFQASFFKDIYHVNLKENAFLGALPHLLMTIVVPLGGIVADKIRKKGILNTTQVRKLFNCGGFGMEATFFIVTAYAQAFTQGITALTIGVAFSGFAISGFNVNHLDIAPRYASILMGLSNGIGTMSFVTCNLMKSVYGYDLQTKEEWRIVLVFSACVHYAGITFYGLFASGEQQPWADQKAEIEKQQWSELDQPMPLKGSQVNSTIYKVFKNHHHHLYTTCRYRLLTETLRVQYLYDDHMYVRSCGSHQQ